MFLFKLIAAWYLEVNLEKQIVGLKVTGCFKFIH